MAYITPDELRARFTDAGHGEIAEELIAGARRAVAVVGEECEDAEIEVGESKLGGLPDLPEGVEWPRRDGRPLAFLAQLSMADVPRAEGEPALPRRGLLSIFYDVQEQPWGFDPKDRGGAVVMHWPEPRGLARAEAPKGTYDTMNEEYDRPFAARRVRYEVVTTYPELGESVFEMEDGEEVMDLYDETVNAGQGEESPHHQLLGHPLVVQNPMEEECQLVTNGLYLGDELSPEDEKRAEGLREGAKDWTLLLQLDSDEHWMWGDMGLLYFWIRRQDLEAGEFSKAWCILQCS